jgi:hypothetical protein
MVADEYFLLVCDDEPNEVVLTDPGPHPIEVVKMLHRKTGLSLWHSKVLISRYHPPFSKTYRKRWLTRRCANSLKRGPTLKYGGVGAQPELIRNLLICGCPLQTPFEPSRLPGEARLSAGPLRTSSGDQHIRSASR